MKNLKIAMAASKGSITVEAFLYTLYRSALREGFDAIKYKNKRYRMQQRFFVLFSSKVGTNIRSSFTKWRYGTVQGRLQDLENTFKFAAIASRLSNVYQYFYVQRLSECFRRWKNNPQLLYKRALRTIIERTVSKMQLYNRIWLQKALILRDKAKYQKIYDMLKRIDDHNKKVIRTNFNRWGGTAKRKMVLAMKHMLEVWQYGLRTYFMQWHRNVIEAREELINQTSHDIYRLAFILIKYNQLGKKYAFNKLSRLVTSRLKLAALHNLNRNIKKMLVGGLKAFEVCVWKHRFQNEI